MLDTIGQMKREHYIFVAETLRQAYPRAKTDEERHNIIVSVARIEEIVGQLFRHAEVPWDYQPPWEVLKTH